MFMFVHVGGSNYKFVKSSDIRREDNYSDIYDGELYRNLASESILQGISYVTVTFNTNGIPVFQSSKYLLWPLDLIVNEFPVYQRFI